MDHTAAGRLLIGDSLGFHLLFITFGVGLPVMISLLELYGIVTKRPHARELAHTWAKALVILFIAGAVSGTIISLQFSLLWPHFLEFANKVVGVSFAMEGSLFLIEALFLSIYMLSWDKFKPWAHWSLSLFMVLGAVGSAFFITSVNGFMNTPQGFQLDTAGNLTNINAWQGVFNPSMLSEFWHSVSSYLFTCALVLMAFHAWPLIRRRKPNPRDKRLLTGLAILTLIFGASMALAGDNNGKIDAKYEPLKLAAAEGLQDTQRNAPLTLGGIPDQDGKFQYGIVVPGLLSFLATGDFNGEVKGLNDFARSDRPPVITHYFFDFMVLIGLFILAVVIVWLALRAWKPHVAMKRGMLWLLVISAPLAMIALELGWMLTELGRQPYIIKGYMTTSQALTGSQWVISLGYIFPILFVILIALTVVALRHTLKTRQEETA